MSLYCFCCCDQQAEASNLLAELEQLRALSGDHAAMAAENTRLKGERREDNNAAQGRAGQVLVLVLRDKQFSAHRWRHE